MQQSLKNPILVTGGAGYIGSHTVVELLQAQRDVVVIDNLDNSCIKVMSRIAEIVGKAPTFIEGDIRDSELLTQLFKDYEFTAVIHFAGLKAVGESVSEPLRYYQNNVAGALQLVRCMAQFNCTNLVFSSSATVYGDPASVPIREDFPLAATNPYGHSKLMIENILRDLAAADPRWKVSILRYFNPVAAHPSGLIGEDPNGIPNNLLPYIAQVGVGKLPQLTVHGNDYRTADGTGVRDYIHVVDLAKAHLAALAGLADIDGCETYNIGTGKGYSVLEMIKAFEAASGQHIAYQVGPRRQGDIGSCYADAQRAARQLGWRAQLGLEEMMQDHWRWQSQNPNGYN